MSWLWWPKEYFNMFFPDYDLFHIFCNEPLTSKWRIEYREVAKSWRNSTMWCGTLAESAARAADWHVASQHRNDECCSSSRATGKETWWIAKGRVTEKKTKWSCHQELFLAGNICICHHLPFQQIMTVPCTWLAHTKTATGDWGQQPCGQQYTPSIAVLLFLPFTFLLLFYFFTGPKDLNGKMDVFLLLIPPLSRLRQY